MFKVRFNQSTDLSECVRRPSIRVHRISVEHCRAIASYTCSEGVGNGRVTGRSSHPPPTHPLSRRANSISTNGIKTIPFKAIVRPGLNPPRFHPSPPHRIALPSQRGTEIASYVKNPFLTRKMFLRGRVFVMVCECYPVRGFSRTVLTTSTIFNCQFVEES